MDGLTAWQERYRIESLVPKFGDREVLESRKQKAANSRSHQSSVRRSGINKYKASSRRPWPVSILPASPCDNLLGSKSDSRQMPLVERRAGRWLDSQYQADSLVGEGIQIDPLVWSSRTQSDSNVAPVSVHSLLSLPLQLRHSPFFIHAFACFPPFSLSPFQTCFQGGSIYSPRLI